MPRNGIGGFTRTNGAFTGANVWALDSASLQGISSERHDIHDQDIADAITGSIASNGVSTITADLPMGGFKHTGVADGNARDQYASCGQAQDGTVSYAGTAAVSVGYQYNVNLTPAIPEYIDGMMLRFIAQNNNLSPDGASIGATISNSAGAKNLVFERVGASSGLCEYAIGAGRYYEVIYSSPNDICQIVNSGSPWFNYQSVTPAGATQGTATAVLQSSHFIIADSSGSGGIILPAVQTGASLYIVNTGASLNIYPAVGQYFVGQAINTPYVAAAQSVVILVGYVDTWWTI